MFYSSVRRRLYLNIWYVASVRTHAFFAELKDSYLFSEVTVNVGGHGIVWNDDLYISSDELWENGVIVETPFDGLMAFSDATDLWN